MRKVELEKHEFKVDNVEKPVIVEESDLVFAASRFKTSKQEKKTVYSLKEFQQFSRIDDRLKELSKENKILELEDGDFQFLYDKLKEVEWLNSSEKMVKVVLNLVKKFDDANKKEKK